MNEQLEFLKKWNDVCNDIAEVDRAMPETDAFKKDLLKIRCNLWGVMLIYAKNNLSIEPTKNLEDK